MCLSDSNYSISVLMDSDHADSMMLPVNCLLFVCWNSMFFLKINKRSDGILFLVLCIFEIHNYLLLWYPTLSFANIRCLKYCLFLYIYIVYIWKHKYLIILDDFVNFGEHWGIFLLDVKWNFLEWLRFHYCWDNGAWKYCAKRLFIVYLKCRSKQRNKRSEYN